jgi:hypothetical protein
VLPLLLLLGCQDTETPTEPLRLSPASAPQLAQMVTRITELGSLGGSPFSFHAVAAINDFGQIVGTRDPRRPVFTRSVGKTVRFPISERWVEISARPMTSTISGRSSV